MAMASPAPFTQQPTSPSSFTYERPASRARVSAGGSDEVSRISATSGRRKSSLSSMLIFASIALTSPSGVVMSGLISAMDEPELTKES